MESVMPVGILLVLSYMLLKPRRSAESPPPPPWPIRLAWFPSLKDVVELLGCATQSAFSFNTVNHH